MRKSSHGYLYSHFYRIREEGGSAPPPHRSFENQLRNHSGGHWESFRENLLIKSRTQNIFEKFKRNRNLQTIPFKMVYNMSILRHRFSNERCGGRRPEPPSSLILQKCVLCLLGHSIRFYLDS